MNSASYPPVNKLLSCGVCEIGRQWPNYLVPGFGPEHIPDLIRMALDPELNQSEQIQNESAGEAKTTEAVTAEEPQAITVFLYKPLCYVPSPTPTHGETSRSKRRGTHGRAGYE
jgi:hypothetical protein